MSDYDAIVVGAGNGGLTAATTLQRAGMRTLLVERHNVPGGCATSFRRGRFEFEVALHQLSGVGREGQAYSMRGLFDALGVADTVDFVEEHELYRAVVPGVVDVTLPADWAGLVEAVEAAFPGNRDRTERFLELVRTVAFWQVAAMRGVPADRVDPVLFRHGLRPLADVLDDCFADPALKTVLGIYWTYLGEPPATLPFQDFAILLFAYLEFKPWHVRGGSQAMSSAILDSFVAAGGEVVFNAAVERISVRGGRVAGVRLDDAREASAPVVVSNASPHATYAMLDGIDVPAGVRRDLATRPIGVSAVVLHMGLDATADELGFASSTTFVNVDTDDQRTFDAAASLEPARGICMSCYDVAPIGFAPPGATHVSVVALARAAAWQSLDPSDYHRAKFAYADAMLDLAERAHPGIRDVIEEVDVATPLTMMRYLGHPEGAIYGYRQDATESWLFRGREPDAVPGLHFAGAWTGMGGFQPSLEAGARVARRILRSQAA